MVERVTVFVPGRVFWAKIVGDKALVSNYDGDAREWTYELAPDDTTFLKDNKLLDRLKDREDAKNPDKGDFLLLKKPEFDRDGNKNEPIRIYDENNEAWDDRLLGNGTRVVAKLSIVNWGKGKKSSIYTQALRVEGLVPYVSNEFGGYDGPSSAPKKPVKAAKAKAVATELDDLPDDDMPF